MRSALEHYAVVWTAAQKSRVGVNIRQSAYSSRCRYLERNGVSESPERPECAGRLFHGELVKPPLHHAQLFRTSSPRYSSSAKSVRKAQQKEEGQTPVASVARWSGWMRLACFRTACCAHATQKITHTHTHQKRRKRRKKGVIGGIVYSRTERRSLQEQHTNRSNTARRSGVPPFPPPVSCAKYTYGCA